MNSTSHQPNTDFALLRILTITALFASVVVTTWSTNVTGKQDGQKQKTLRELGAERNIRVQVPDVEYDSEYFDLKSLTRAAYAIVVGRIVEEQSGFDGDNHIVTTSCSYIGARRLTVTSC